MSNDLRVAMDHLYLIKSHMLALNNSIIIEGSQLAYNPSGIVKLRSGVLSVRMILEELMLLSVSAHKDAGEKISKALQGDYRATKKMILLEKINPKFFPDAIDIVPSEKEDIAGRFVRVDVPYLTKEDARKFYSWSGNLLHASHKQLPAADFLEVLQKIVYFYTLAERLMRTFEVDISGAGLLYLGHLNLENEGPPTLFYTGRAD